MRLPHAVISFPDGLISIGDRAFEGASPLLARIPKGILTASRLRSHAARSSAGSEPASHAPSGRAMIPLGRDHDARGVRGSWMAKGSGIGDFGCSSLEHPRLWVGGLWLGRTLGVPGCPELQGAP